MSESLLPGTDAITRGTVEVYWRGSKWLVRYRDLSGAVWREQPRSAAEADRIFWRWVEDLRRMCRRA